MQRAFHGACCVMLASILAQRVALCPVALSRLALVCVAMWSLRDVFKRWAMVVEKRKCLALLDRLNPYQHVDTDDGEDDGDHDSDSSEWEEGVSYCVVKIQLPRRAG